MPAIARVFGGPGMINKVITTRPGHQVQIRGGMGYVFHKEDMVALLRRDDISIEVVPDQADWLSSWAQLCGERTPARAMVTIPGKEIGPPPTYDAPDAAAADPPAVRRRQGKGAKTDDLIPPDRRPSSSSSIEQALNDVLGWEPADGENRDPAGS